MNAKRYYAPKFCSPAVLLNGLGFRHDCIIQVTRSAEQVEWYPVLIVLLNLEQFSSKGYYQFSFFLSFKIMGPNIMSFFYVDRRAHLCVEKEVNKLWECWCFCIPFQRQQSIELISFFMAFCNFHFFLLPIFHFSLSINFKD